MSQFRSTDHGGGGMVAVQILNHIKVWNIDPVINILN
jgi:hypothetical protein